MGFFVTTIAKYFGEPLSCNGGIEFEKKSIEDYCFAYSFSYVSEKFRNLSLCSISSVDGDVSYFKYIHSLLLMCAGLLLTPILLWQSSEKLFKSILNQIDVHHFLKKYDEKSSKFRKTFVTYLGLVASEFLLLIAIFLYLDFLEK